MIKFYEDLEGVVQTIPLGEKIFLEGNFRGEHDSSDLGSGLGSKIRPGQYLESSKKHDPFSPIGVLNEHVGSYTRGFQGFRGGYDIGKTNMEGKSILDFSPTFDFTIEEDVITYKSGVARSQTDFFRIRKSYRKFCLDCKVISGESLTVQHRVLVLDVWVKSKLERKRQHIVTRIK
ncbi:hypothetical protein Lal_00018766 [Lupinus albus]|nr:hypothetical protein Lal_00018766 [Lupinus albus]